MTDTPHNPRRGRFITLEGTEGVGKSTNMRRVCAVLQKAGIDCFETREPGGTPVAERLRDVLLKDSDEAVLSITELLVVFAARAQHLAHEIIPRLEKGQWVVCDRFTDATFAYQGYARGVDLRYVEQLEQWVQQGLQPDLTILLDLDPEIAMQRIEGRPKDRMENEQLQFYQSVRRGYIERAQLFSRFQVIDAGAPLEKVGEQIDRCVKSFVKSQATGNGGE